MSSDVADNTLSTAAASFSRILSDPNVQQASSFDPRVFWSINAVWITVLLSMIIWCWSGGADRLSGYINGGSRASDQAYTERLRQRREREEESKKESPEQRRATLQASFQRNKVHMVVEEADFVDDQENDVSNKEAQQEHTAEKEDPFDLKKEEDPSKADPGDATFDAMENGASAAAELEHRDGARVNPNEGNESVSHDSLQNDTVFNQEVAVNTSDTQDDGEDHNTTTNEEYNGALDSMESQCDAFDTGAPSYMKLRTTKGQRTVPNCCAVCLCSYEVGESVIWSSNPECPHAFHEDCVIEWFFKMQNGTPCPCCRQEFTDLKDHKQSKQAAATAVRPPFDVSVIRL